MPINLNKIKIENWKSKLFKLQGKIENYALQDHCNGDDWTYTDNDLANCIFIDETADFTIALTNVPLENNYYARRIGNNIVAITFFQMNEVLKEENIPLENLVLRCIYAYSLIYLRFDRNISSLTEVLSRKFTHDEVRGCLFDMTGWKTEVIYSCNKPILCDSCIQKMKEQKVSTEKIKTVKTEIKRIKKDFFYELKDKFQKYPRSSFIILVISSTIISQLTLFISKYIYHLFT